jgi:hypothetical protein
VATVGGRLVGRARAGLSGPWAGPGAARQTPRMSRGRALGGRLRRFRDSPSPGHVGMAPRKEPPRITS